MSKLLPHIIIVLLASCGIDPSASNKRKPPGIPPGSSDQLPDELEDQNPSGQDDKEESQNENLDFNTYSNYGLSVDLQEENITFDKATVKVEPQNGRLEGFEETGRFEYHPNNGFYGYDEVVLTIHRKKKKQKKDLKIKFSVHKDAEKKWKVKTNRRPIAGSCQRIIIERSGSLDDLAEKDVVSIFSSRRDGAIRLFRNKECGDDDVPSTRKIKFKSLQDRKGFYTLIPERPGRVQLSVISENDGEEYSKTIKIEIQESSEDDDFEDEEDDA